MAKHQLNLDLLAQETFDVTFGGKTVQIKQPPENMLFKINEAIKQMSAPGFGVEDGVALTAEVAAEILSNNTAGEVFSVEIVKKDISLNGRTALMMGYMEFVTDLSKNPN